MFFLVLEEFSTFSSSCFLLHIFLSFPATPVTSQLCRVVDMHVSNDDPLLLFQGCLPLLVRLLGETEGSLLIYKGSWPLLLWGARSPVICHPWSEWAKLLLRSDIQAQETDAPAQAEGVSSHSLVTFLFSLGPQWIGCCSPTQMRAMPFTSSGC